MTFKGSLCFLFANFLNSCLFKRHSLSNHFLFVDNWTRLCFFIVFIFKQRFAVAMKMFSTFLKEMLTFAVDSLSFRNSRINVWVLGDRSASLNFCVESCSQQNCFGKLAKVSLTFHTGDFFPYCV